MSALVEVAALFLKLGFTAFGGPAAHIAIMHDEVVIRRKWLTDEQFLDLLGATNLIPGEVLATHALMSGHIEDKVMALQSLETQVSKATRS